MREVRLLLPIPPSANNLFVNRRGNIGSRRKGVPYKLWLHEAGWEVKRQAGAFVPPLIPGIVAVDILAPLNRRRDLDNALKGLLDLLVRQHIIADDNLIDDLRIRRFGTGDKVLVCVAFMTSETKEAGVPVEYRTIGAVEEGTDDGGGKDGQC